jgi:hypothetical protein
MFYDFQDLRGNQGIIALIMSAHQFFHGRRFSLIRILRVSTFS